MSDTPFASPLWRQQAACRGLDPALFYSDPSSMEWLEAMQTCLACPVRVECLDEALANNERIGIWGGTSPARRRALRRPARACLGCAIPIDPGENGQRRYCPACRAERDRASDRESQQQRRVAS